MKKITKQEKEDTKALNDLSKKVKSGDMTKEEYVKDSLKSLHLIQSRSYLSHAKRFYIKQQIKLLKQMLKVYKSVK